MVWLVECSNCCLQLHLSPGAKSIRCSECQAVTRIDYASVASSPPSDVPPVSVLAAQHMPSPSTTSVRVKKKALIVGISYKFTKHELKGCINDAKYMKHLLITRFHFPESSILMLTEEETDPTLIPTTHNMRIALGWLIHGCEAGDSLLFHFSGHGSRQRNYNDGGPDSYDATLCPLDFETEGMISDAEVNATIVQPLPIGAKLHAIIDSRNSGSVLDLPFPCLPFLCRMDSIGGYAWEDHRATVRSRGEVISISGSCNSKTSPYTSVLSQITSSGLLTYCFIEAIEHGNASTYGTLLSSMRNTLRRATRGVGGGGGAPSSLLHKMWKPSGCEFIQELQLNACEPFDIYAKPFFL